jgi:hypothetical protein
MPWSATRRVLLRCSKPWECQRKPAHLAMERTHAQLQAALFGRSSERPFLDLEVAIRAPTGHIFSERSSGASNKHHNAVSDSM